MSTSNTSEAYFADRDLFLRYIESRVNPARKAEGLELISKAAATRCYDIIVNETHRNYAKDLYA